MDNYKHLLKRMTMETKPKPKPKNVYDQVIANILADDNYVSVQESMIAGGIAPSVISGKLGHGRASSGFINEEQVDDTDITFLIN